MERLRREFGLLKEKAEVLAGERGAPAQHALRRGALARLGSLPPITSREVSGTPTADDFNALRKDIEAIHKALSALGELAQGRR